MARLDGILVVRDHGQERRTVDGGNDRMFGRFRRMVVED